MAPWLRNIPAAVVASALVAGCATGSPITISSSSPASAIPPSSGAMNGAPRRAVSRAALASPQADGVSACAVYLGDVSDVRPNPSDFGTMGLRPVLVADSVSWLQSALETFKQDPRLRFVSEVETGLAVRIELMKAYVMAMATQKSAVVVLRVTYRSGGKDLEPQIARGQDTSANMAFGEKETETALNRAMVMAVKQLDEGVVGRCRAAPPSKN